MVDHSLLRSDFKRGQIPRGSRGPRGLRGSQGTTGAQGTQGPQGPKGEPTYHRTILVSPSSDNDSVNGQALRDALASITDAASNKPYLVKLEPGTYHLGPTGLQMKPYVDIEGSGVLQTHIWASVSSADTSGAVIGSSNSQLRWLSVTNDLPPGFVLLPPADSIAIYAKGPESSVSLEGVRAFAIGGFDAFGMFIDGASATIERSSIVGSSEGSVTGMFPDGFPSEGLRLANTIGVPSLTARVRDSEIRGDTSGVRASHALILTIDGSRVSGGTQAVIVTGPAETHIGASQIAGSVTTQGGGTLTCAQSYDGSYVDLGPACT